MKKGRIFLGNCGGEKQTQGQYGNSMRKDGAPICCEKFTARDALMKNPDDHSDTQVKG
ncbi:hypothetical protein [Verrucomicrobium spinosum]|uniref:hypothetical protein n=1 Tax=Verrucomicrobium spinosum TaxID=2736 RepID=UPI0012E21156|nr:hypothetical protein [Verrucomicrobium spinosum]